MKKIIAVQLFGANHQQDVAVFADAIRVLVNEGHQVKLITDDADLASSGIVANSNVNLIGSSTYSANGLIKSICALFTQIHLFFLVLKIGRPGNIVYINSVYPIAAALAAKINCAKVFFHIQNSRAKLNTSEYIILALANSTANHVVFSSQNLKQRLNFTVQKQSVVYSAPTNQFTGIAQKWVKQRKVSDAFTVLMISEINKQRNIKDFFELAKMLPQFTFELALTDGFGDKKQQDMLSVKPANVNVFKEHQNFHSFYRYADVMINLSSSNKYLQSNYINVLQAMYYGIPVIAPQKGGLKELLGNKNHGLVVNTEDLNAICSTLKSLSQSEALYNMASVTCKKQALMFNANVFESQITNLFKSKQINQEDTVSQWLGLNSLNDSFSKLSNHREAAISI